MAGWLTFEQMQSGVGNLREAELAKPLELIARGHHYEVKGEMPLPKAEARLGTSSRLDFLLVNRELRLIIAIEMKYKKKNKKMAGALAVDARRLRALTPEALDAQIQDGLGGSIKDPIAGYALIRAVLIVWRQSDIMEQMQREPPIIRRHFNDLAAALLPRGTKANNSNLAKVMAGKSPMRPVARAKGAIRPGSTYTSKRFWVAVLIDQPNWANL